MVDSLNSSFNGQFTNIKYKNQQPNNQRKKLLFQNRIIKNRKFDDDTPNTTHKKKIYIKYN